MCDAVPDGDLIPAITPGFFGLASEFTPSSSDLEPGCRKWPTFQVSTASHPLVIIIPIRMADHNGTGLQVPPQHGPPSLTSIQLVTHGS